VVVLPRDEHPGINFRSRLIGPKGQYLQAVENETGATIVIRGPGLVKERRCNDGQPFLGEDEPLEAFITSNNEESVAMAVERVRNLSRILKLEDIDSNFRYPD
jgi:hypothetical protein